jgi:hypothetical protein
MVTEPNAELLLAPEIPRVSLGGKLWPVPKLAIRQLRRMRGKLDPIFDLVIRKVTPPQDLTDDQFDDMAFVVWVGLTRGHPTLSIPEFEELGITWTELVAALVTVWLQAIGPAGKGASGEGEGAPQSPPIGTASSLGSPTG